MQGQAHHARARSQNALIVGAGPVFVQRHLTSMIRHACPMGLKTERHVSLDHRGILRRGRGFTPC